MWLKDQDGCSVGVHFASLRLLYHSHHDVQMAVVVTRCSGADDLYVAVLPAQVGLFHLMTTNFLSRATVACVTRVHRRLQADCAVLMAA